MSRRPIRRLQIVFSSLLLLGAACLPSALAQDNAAEPGPKSSATSRPASAPSTAPSRSKFSASAFFTDDDGHTFFPASIHSIPPFEHNGKEAVRAYVFTTDGGKTRFVAYLEKYTPEAKQALERMRDQAASTPSQPPSASAVEQITQGSLVKKPGQSGWVNMKDDAAYSKVVQIQTPP